jgi:SAM-dependent methyltransferase
MPDATDGERLPTSHERRARQPWNASYLGARAPWDIGRPQPAIVRLARDGAFTGAVLDAGCGTGENALLVASCGLAVLGVDVAQTAIGMAREKAAARGIQADFVVADALNLDRLERTFDTVLDCGLFHTFDHEERREYVASLAAVTGPGAILHILCFSDVDPGAAGPHPVSERELRAGLNHAGWSVRSVVPERLETTFNEAGAPAWLAKVERTN